MIDLSHETAMQARRVMDARNQENALKPRQPRPRRPVRPPPEVPEVSASASPPPPEEEADPIPEHIRQMLKAAYT